MKATALFVLMYLMAVVFVMTAVRAQTTAKSTEDLAMEGAEVIWGLNAKLGRVKRATDKEWTYQVGCYFNEQIPFIVAGEGASWSQALASVDRNKNGSVTLFNGQLGIACNGRSQ